MPSTRSQGRAQPTLPFPRRRSCRVSSCSKTPQLDKSPAPSPPKPEPQHLAVALTQIGPLSLRRPADPPTPLSPKCLVDRPAPFSPNQPASQPPSPLSPRRPAAPPPTPSSPGLHTRLPLSPRKRTGDDNGCNLLGSPPKQSKPALASPLKLSFDENSPVSAHRQLFSPTVRSSPRRQETPAGSPVRYRCEKRPPVARLFAEKKKKKASFSKCFTQRCRDASVRGQAYKAPPKQPAPRDTITDESCLKLDPKTATTKTKVSSCFTPDRVLDEHGETSYRFKCPSPGVYQCASTQLVFKLTQEAELSYKIIQWDKIEPLFPSYKRPDKRPAGPLYHIECSEKAVTQLCLPHCEALPAPPNEDLCVAHFCNDMMDILKPLEITDTHVVVNVPHLSALGLICNWIKKFLNIKKRIIGQVLLFHHPKFTEQLRKLNIFLLPANVPLREVKQEQENAEYIENPAFCVLTEGQTYTVCCSEAHEIHYSRAPFDIEYGTNYHPTFEIRLDRNTNDATVVVQDQEEREVWKYRVKFTGLGSASSTAALSALCPANEPVSLPAAAEEAGSPPASGSAAQSTHSPPSEQGSLLVAAGGAAGTQMADGSTSISAQEKSAASLLQLIGVNVHGNLTISTNGPDPSEQNLPGTQSLPGREEEKLSSVHPF